MESRKLATLAGSDTGMFSTDFVNSLTREDKSVSVTDSPDGLLAGAGALVGAAGFILTALCSIAGEAPGGGPFISHTMI